MTKRLVLLIGNTQFDDKNFTELVTPKNDIEDFAMVLERYGDFEIVDKLLNASIQTVKMAIEDFYKKAQRGDLTLLYYSGHGQKVRSDQLFLIVKDTISDRLLSTGLPEAFVQEAMGVSFSQHKIVILDCCFSGAFIKGHKSGAEQLAFEKLKGEATAVLASSSRTQHSFEETGRHSLFTHYLIDGIRTGEADEDLNGWISVEELFEYAAKGVKNTRPDQTPMMEMNTRNTKLYIARNTQKPTQGLSTRPDAKSNQWVAVFSKGTPYLDQICHTSRLFPEDVIKTKSEEGYCITSLAYGAGKWVVILSRGHGYSDQLWYLRRNFPYIDINRRLEQGYRVTNLAHGRGRWVVILSKGSDYSDQSCHLRKSFPSSYIKRKDGRVTSLAYGGGRWAFVLSKGSGYVGQWWWATSQFPSESTDEFIEETWQSGYRITNLVYGDGKWAIMTSKGCHYQEQSWYAMRTLPNDAMRRLWDEGWHITQLSFGPV